MGRQNEEAWRATIDELRANPRELDQEAWLTRMSAFWNPEIEFDTSEVPGSDWSGVYLGRDAILQLWREWLAALEVFIFDYQVVSAGDQVVTLIEWRPREHLSASEAPVWRNAWVCTFREGLMTHAKLFMSHPAALEAAGLWE